MLCSFDMDCDMPGWPPFSPPSHAKPVKLTDGPSSNLWTKIIQISEIVAVRHLRLTNNGIFLTPISDRGIILMEISLIYDEHLFYIFVYLSAMQKSIWYFFENRDFHEPYFR